MKNQNLDTGESYFKKIFDNRYDEEKKNIAISADTYADLIFSSPVDNMSYLRSKQYFWKLITGKEFFYKKEKKLTNSKIKILHAPTNMMFKGTPLVRAAIKKLQMENYVFDYVELQNTNSMRLSQQYLELRQWRLAVLF